VVAFSASEKIIIEIDNDAIIMYGLYLSVWFSTLAQRITGSNGNTQGANMVNTPARNDNTSSVII